MDRSNTTVPAIYGYTVCLVAVLLFVAASVGIVNNVFRTVNPTFEGSHHRISMRWSRPHGLHGFGQRGGDVAQTGRGAMIARGRLNAVRALVVSFVLLVISIALFTGHWRWLNARRGGLTALPANGSD
jgi:hypothetical protein